MSPTPAEETVEDALTARIARQEILPRIDADLVAEHRENPFGPHGDDLQRVIAFLGRRPTAGSEVIVMDRPHDEWAIARVAPERGGGFELTDERFATQRAAQHAVFLRRLAAFADRFAGGDLPGVDLAAADDPGGDDGEGGPDR